MKKFLSLLTAVIIVVSANGQQDTIFAELNNESIMVHHNNIYVQCGAQFMTNIYITGNTISIYEKDTSMSSANCLCHFNLTTAIDSVANGNYSIFYYCISQQMYTADTALYGTLQFLTGANLNGIITKTTIQSSCINEIGEINSTTEHYLNQNIPNPFSTTTTIEFVAPENGAKLKIFNSNGQLIKVIDKFKKGMNKFTWDMTDMNGRKISEGVYYYTLTTSVMNEVRKMIIVK